MKKFLHEFTSYLSGLGVALPFANQNGGRQGTDIVEPWLRCRQLVFVLRAGALGGQVTLNIEGKLRSNGAYEQLKDPTGAVIAVAGTEYASGGKLENGAVVEVLPLNRLGSDDPSEAGQPNTFAAKYSALRVSVNTAGATDIGVDFFEFDPIHYGGDEAAEFRDRLFPLMIQGRSPAPY